MMSNSHQNHLQIWIRTLVCFWFFSRRQTFSFFLCETGDGRFVCCGKSHIILVAKPATVLQHIFANRNRDSLSVFCVTTGHDFILFKTGPQLYFYSWGKSGHLTWDVSCLTSGFGGRKRGKIGGKQFGGTRQAECPAALPCHRPFLSSSFFPSS